MLMAGALRQNILSMYYAFLKFRENRVSVFLLFISGCAVLGGNNVRASHCG